MMNRAPLILCLLSAGALLASIPAPTCATDVPLRPAAGVSDAKRAEKAARYRHLTLQYEQLSDDERDSKTGRELRRASADLCQEILTDHLPAGTSKEQIVELLGKPAGDQMDRLLYRGTDFGWFFSLKLEKGKLARHQHLRILDFEGGK